MNTSPLILCARFAAIAALLVYAPASAREPFGPIPLDQPGYWVTPDDYPKTAMMDHKQGVVRFVVEVDPTGKPVECKVVQSSGDEELDITACKLVTLRARFLPARDEKDRAVTGRYANSVKWVLPKTLSAPRLMALTFTMLIDADGAIAECRIMRAEGAVTEAIAEKKGPCDQDNDFEPYKDAAGNPVARRVTFSTEVKIEAP